MFGAIIIMCEGVGWQSHLGAEVTIAILTSVKHPPLRLKAVKGGHGVEEANEFEQALQPPLLVHDLEARILEHALHAIGEGENRAIERDCANARVNVDVVNVDDEPCSACSSITRETACQA
eukprot:scaffold20010_cov64-Phaeocystis_antarctica.AAC.3